MIEYINSIELGIVAKALLFFIVCFLVMTYYYIEDWFQNKPTQSLLDYLLLNNPRGTYLAIKRLILLAFGASILGHLDQVQISDILITAAGIGWLAYSNRSDRNNEITNK